MDAYKIIMIASVQYNDLRGTAAADVSDFMQNSLQSFLVDSFTSYDSEQYFCTGCKIWIGGQNRLGVSISFICWDKNNEKYVCFSPLKDYSVEEVFQLFKRLEIVMGTDISEIEINHQDYFDLE